MVRVNNRGVPKSLAGVPVSRDVLERIKLRVQAALPPRPMERPLSDLLAAAYMAGMVDAVADPRVGEALSGGSDAKAD